MDLAEAFPRQVLPLTWPAIATHAGFAVLLFALSLATTRLLLRRVRVLDHPTAGSARRKTTPTLGGLSIVLTFLVGVAALDAQRIGQGYFAGFVASCLTIAGVSLYGDLVGKPFLEKLSLQLGAIGIAVASGIVLDVVSLPGIGPVPLAWESYIFSFLWILAVTNAFTFMDGLDGLAGGTSAIVCFFFMIITASLGSSFVSLHCYTLLAGILGFLVYNVPPARIFMGDVGSATLGFLFATLAILAARYDASHTSFMVMPLLLFTFLYDTGFTFIRRWLAGLDVTQPHRSHLYQLLNRLGYSQGAVALAYCLAAAVHGRLALWMLQVEGSKRAGVFVPILLLHIAYGAWVVRLAKKRGLLDSNV